MCSLSLGGRKCDRGTCMIRVVDELKIEASGHGSDVSCVASPCCLLWLLLSRIRQNGRGGWEGGKWPSALSGRSGSPMFLDERVGAMRVETMAEKGATRRFEGVSFP